MVHKGFESLFKRLLRWAGSSGNVAATFQNVQRYISRWCNRSCWLLSPAWLAQEVTNTTYKVWNEQYLWNGHKNQAWCYCRTPDLTTRVFPENRSTCTKMHVDQKPWRRVPKRYQAKSKLNQNTVCVEALCDLHKNSFCFNPSNKLSAGQRKLVMITLYSKVTIATVEQSVAVVMVIRTKHKCVWWGLDDFIVLILVFFLTPVLRRNLRAHKATPTQAVECRPSWWRCCWCVCWLRSATTSTNTRRMPSASTTSEWEKHTHTHLFVVMVTTFPLFFPF